MGFLDELNPENIMENLGIPNPAGDYIKGPERAAQISADATLSAAREAEALNRERYGEAGERLTPYMESEARARNQYEIEMGLAPGEAGTAYMNTPGYETAMSEAMRGANTGAQAMGSPYGGRAMEARARAGTGVQQQYYNNYMNALSGMAQPQVTQNYSSLGMGQGATIGAQNIGAAGQAGQFRQAGAQSTQQAQGDVLGGVIKMMGFL
jgi:hypothetical protein